MKVRCLLAGLGLVLGAAWTAVPAAEPEAAARPLAGEVIANRLNVRSKAGMQSEVVCQLHAGDKVVVLRQTGEWAGIRPPPKTEAWVPAKDVADGKVAAPQAKVYAGANLVFSTYAELPRDSAVKVLETRGEWLRIEPPLTATVWVNTRFLKIAEGSAPAPLAAEAALAPEPPATVDSLPPGEFQPQLKLLADRPLALPELEQPQPAPEGQSVAALANEPASDAREFLGSPSEVTRSGTVVRLPHAAGDARAFALAVRVGAVYYPVAYLDQSWPELEKRVGQEVQVTGLQRWVRDWPRPLLTPTQLGPVPAQGAE